jgi:hypothetical protein
VKTTALKLIALLVFCLAAKAAPPGSVGLIMTLTPTEKAFIEGEPVFCPAHP